MIMLRRGWVEGREGGLELTLPLGRIASVYARKATMSDPTPKWHWTAGWADAAKSGDEETAERAMRECESAIIDVLNDSLLIVRDNYQSRRV